MIPRESSVIIVKDQFPRAYFFRGRNMSPQKNSSSFKQSNQNSKDGRELRQSLSSTSSNFGKHLYYNQQNSSNDNTTTTQFKDYIKPSLPLLNIRKKISLHEDLTCKSQRTANNLMTEYDEKIRQLLNPHKQKFKWELPNPMVENAKIYTINSVKGNSIETSRASSIPKRRIHSPLEEQRVKVIQVSKRYAPKMDWIGKDTSIHKEYLEKKQIRESNIRAIDKQLSILLKQKQN